MLHRLILKVTKFQLPPPKRLSTVVKNILAIIAPMSNRVKIERLRKYDCSIPKLLCFSPIIGNFYDVLLRQAQLLVKTKQLLPKVFDQCKNHFVLGGVVSVIKLKTRF